MALIEKINKIKEIIINLIFPKICLSCSKEGSCLCQTCLEKLTLISHFCCPACHKISAFGITCKSCEHRTHLKGAIYALDYKNQITAKAIKNLKYHSVKELVDPLAEILIKMIKNSHFLSINFSTNVSSSIIIPVPLHHKKFLWRGFNQSELLAKKIAEEFEINFKNNVLFKIKNTPSQTGLDLKKRKTNVVDSFAIKNHKEIKNKIIFLIDDLFTTGSTINEAAKVLKKAGAKQVWGITLARG